MGKIILITGGARSGKSSFAQTLAKKKKGKVAFIATAQAKDAEMKKRIALHKACRSKNWATLEEPLNLEACIKNISFSCKTAIVDCLTLWITNLMMKKNAPHVIENKARLLLEAAKRSKTDIVIVTNEVGLGIVPVSKLGRDFRDIAGRINQLVAQRANEMYFMISGVPLKIK